MKIITIDVTAEDIANGIKTDSARCPVAIAVKRAVGDEPRIYGNDGYINHIYHRFPDAVARFVALFDHGKDGAVYYDMNGDSHTAEGEVEPFTFDFEYHENLNSFYE